MKILYTLDSLNRGGAETLALDVCRNARANGLDLAFAATGGGNLEEEFKTSGAKFFRLQRKLPVDPFVVRGLRQIIREEGITVVHAHQAVEGLHAFLAARGTPAKVVLSHHGFVPDAKTRLTLRFLIPRVAANVVVSEELRNWLRESENLDTSRNFQVLYNGVDEARLVSDRDVRGEFAADDGVLFGMIGNFYAAPRKDQLTVCRALPKVFREVPGARFVFVGGREEGSDYERCVALVNEHGIADRVTFAGVRPDVPDILRALDVFVLSTRHEGLPIALMEAMLAGVASVSSDIAPLVEMTRGGEFGELFPTLDSEALAGSLVKLAADKSYRDALAGRARLYARENFSIEAHLGKLKSLYNSLS